MTDPFRNTRTPAPAQRLSTLAQAQNESRAAFRADPHSGKRSPTVPQDHETNPPLRTTGPEFQFT